jgi:hypothetical protein
MEECNANGKMNKKNSPYAVENNRNFEENENKRYVKRRKDEKKGCQHTVVGCYAFCSRKRVLPFFQRCLCEWAMASFYFIIIRRAMYLA